MQTIEEPSYKQTHKALPLSQRIFYTLTDNDEKTTKQTAKTLGLLVENLVGKGILLEKDIDALCFDGNTP